MPELVGGDNPEDRSLSAKVRDFCSHHWWSYYGVTVGVLIIVNLLHLSWIGFLFVFPALLTWYTVHAKSLQSHQGQLCVKCMQLTPDDPQTTITRYRRDLRFFHWEYANLKNLLIATAGMLFFMFSLSYVSVSIFGVNSILQSIVQPFSVFGPLMVLTRIAHIHSWLRPWCPQCRRWEDGGVHESIPTPDPTGTKTA